MRRYTMLSLAAVLLVSAAAFADPTVTLTLESPQDGLLVPEGVIIQWTITAAVSTGDNEGLALVTCDLVQGGSNPAHLDIPPADGVPAGMSKFSRPGGISNPGETDPTTGYVGVQRGAPGEMNLVQIGGGQNTFGQALPPGTGIGEDPDCIAGVGQGTPQLVASGSIAMPSVCGSYTFSMQNALANVIVTHNDPPDHSPVTQAAVDTTAGTIAVTVTIPGDLDGDFDTDLSDLAQLLGNYGTPSGMSYTDGDIDGDHDVDLSDLAALLSTYGSSCE